MVTTFCGGLEKGLTDGSCSVAKFKSLSGIAVDSTSIYLADQSGTYLRKIDIATKIVSTIAGNGTSILQDGPVASASFVLLQSLVVNQGKLYMVDNYGHAIRKYDGSKSFLVENFL